MNAMVLTKIQEVGPGASPLEAREVPTPEPGPGQIRIRVTACGVCHTELDEIEGRTAPPVLPVVPGHEIVGRIDVCGSEATLHAPGDRVGVGWIFDACGHCDYCREGRENLCADFRATGRDADGGYAEFIVVPEASAYPIPESFDDAEAAPLLCAGGVGYRSLELAQIEDDQTLGFVGFGASAHLVLQMARHRYPNARLLVFSRSGRKQQFARELGADWAAAPGTEPPDAPDAIIDTTPVWRPVEQGMRMLAPGGRLVINAIRKTDADKDALLDIDYGTHLWMEKELVTVANVTREDIRGALELADRAWIRPTVATYPLDEANRALVELAAGSGRGAKVLVV